MTKTPDYLKALAYALPPDLSTEYGAVVRRFVEADPEFWHSRISTKELAAILGYSEGHLRNNRGIGVGYDPVTQSYACRLEQLMAIRKKELRL